MTIEPAIYSGDKVTKAEVIAAIQAEIDAASQRAARMAGHELANASWFVHGLEIALRIVEQLRESETIAEDLQRERFEAWSIASFADGARLSTAVDAEYVDGTTRLLWRTWKAALTWRATT